MKKAILILAPLLTLGIFFLLRPSSYEIVNRVPTNDTIICFGDSLTYGTGAVTAMSYPAQLSKMIGRDVINEGIPGDTTASALERLDEALALNPGMVLITLGGNDMRRGISGDEAFANLETIVKSFQKQGALVVIGGIDIPFFGKKFTKRYGDLARQTGAVLVPNIFDGLWGNPDLMSDSVHPNGKGYTVMASHFREALEPYL